MKGLTSIEVRSITVSMHAKVIAATKIHQELITVFREVVMSRKHVSVWYTACLCRRGDLNDEPCIRRHQMRPLSERKVPVSSANYSRAEHFSRKSP
jgi:hypothetical protein